VWVIDPDSLITAGVCEFVSRVCFEGRMEAP